MEFIPATREILESYYGEPREHTTKAVVAVDDGKVVGVAGISRIEGKWVAFMSATDEARKHKKEFVRGIRAFRKLLNGMNRPVYADADPKINGSDLLLRHAGFKNRGMYYEWTQYH